jgi:ABC-type sulfate transport system permease component
LITGGLGFFFRSTGFFGSTFISAGFSAITGSTDG